MDEKEAAAYLACLELDFSSNAQIARKTKLNRITNYEVLKRLEQRKIVSSYVKRGTKYFMAIDPRVVIKQARERVEIAEESLPEILSIVNQISGKPKIYYFEGIEGIKNIYDDSLTAKSSILTFTNPQDVEELLGKEYADSYIKSRVEKGIKVMGMASDDQHGIAARDMSDAVLREARLFPKEKYEIGNEIMIYDNKIATYSGKDEIGLIVENETLAKTFRNIWQMAWDNAEEFN